LGDQPQPLLGHSVADLVRVYLEVVIFYFVFFFNTDIMINPIFYIIIVTLGNLRMGWKP